MTMQPTILVTIIGPHRTLDLEAPGAIPIRELIPELLEICEPQFSQISLPHPVPWGLGLVGNKDSLDDRRSLIDSGIMDGAVLELLNRQAWVNRQRTWAPADIAGVVVWSDEAESHAR